MNSPAAERNKVPIGEVLKNYLTTSKEDDSVRVLEIASGYGTHAVYFSKLFPHVLWQPTENDQDSLRTILRNLSIERNDGNACGNVLDPVHLDVSRHFKDWPKGVTDYSGQFDLVFNVNMVHISPWKCTLGLFSGAREMLKPSGCLLMYGPFAVNGVLSPQSNIDFDSSLKLSNPQWGIRDLSDLEVVAASESFTLKEVHDMPANNKILAWTRV